MRHLKAIARIMAHLRPFFPTTPQNMFTAPLKPYANKKKSHRSLALPIRPIRIQPNTTWTYSWVKPAPFYMSLASTPKNTGNTHYCTQCVYNVEQPSQEDTPHTNIRTASNLTLVTCESSVAKHSPTSKKKNDTN